MPSNFPNVTSQEESYRRILEREKNYDRNNVNSGERQPGNPDGRMTDQNSTIGNNLNALNRLNILKNKAGNKKKNSEGAITKASKQVARFAVKRFLWSIAVPIFLWLLPYLLVLILILLIGGILIAILDPCNSWTAWLISFYDDSVDSALEVCEELEI